MPDDALTVTMTMIRAILSAIPLVAVLLLAGCGSPKPVDPKAPTFVVAEGKDVEVTREELNSYLDKLLQAEGLNRDMYPPERLRRNEAELAKYLVQTKLILNQKDKVDLAGLEEEVDSAVEEARSKHVNELMFEQHLARAGWNSVDEFRDHLKREATIVRILEANVQDVEEPSEEQITELYEFLLPQIPERKEQVRASHILVRVNTDEDEKAKKAKRKKIEEARKRVLGGEDFAKVATEITDDAYSKPKGGDLAFFTRGQWDPKFDAVAFKTKVGQVSEIFETPYGFHILKVTDRRDPGTVPLAELRPYLVQKYREMELAKKRLNYIDDLVEKADITYNIEMAPPLNGPPAETDPSLSDAAVPDNVGDAPATPDGGPVKQGE